MPSTIPYDPSLVLGNLVTQEYLDNVDAIAAIQGPIDAAEDDLNARIALRRSLDMTVQELVGMSIDATDLVTQRDQVDKDLVASAKAYALAKSSGLQSIFDKKKSIKAVHTSYESPIDYNRTEIKKMTLSADSLNMNVQYFSFDENVQNQSTQISTLKSFVSGELDIFGDSFKSQASGSVQSQATSQYSNHSISGTLVISVSCTHKDAAVLAPFILDVDKGIRVWNKVYPDDMIKTDSVASISKIALESNTANEKSLTLLSGATYGSCFIGMVHVLDTSETRSSESMYSLAEGMQSTFRIGEWFATESGGFGVDSSFSNDMKNLLSTQNVTSHCTLVTLGSIPSIKSNEVRISVQGFTDFDGAKASQQLAALQNSTASEKDTVDSSADAARTGAQMIAMQNAKVQGVLTGLASIDEKANKLLDINSMMDALDDYVQKALAGNLGVPINYYLKPVTKSELAEMWMTKYYPSKFLAISGDDTPATPVTPATGG